MPITQPTAETKAEHLAAAEAALAEAYRAAGPSYEISPDFHALLCSLHLGIASLK
jgi:hypothetical protein